MTANRAVAPVAEAPEIAVRIAESHRGHAAFPGYDVRGTVSNGHRRVDAADLDDWRAQGHDTAHRIGAVRRRVDAVQGGAGTGQIEEIVPTPEDAGGVGEAGRRVRQFFQEGLECVQLLGRLGMIGVVGTGQMADPGPHGDTVEPRWVGREDLLVRRREAETVHAGVEVDEGGKPFAAAPRAGLPGLERLEVVDDRHDVLGDRLGEFGQRQAMQDGDGRLRERGAQGERLAEVCREEDAAAVLKQGLGTGDSPRP